MGRTAAGKSSIFAALFRLTDPNTTTPGGILVDGKDILEQPLHTVRRSITMVPQHPVIFQGTLRFNLDPNNEYDDIQMNTFLRDVRKSIIYAVFFCIMLSCNMLLRIILDWTEAKLGF